MELWELAARESVRDTLARATHAGDRGRGAELAACFTDDGILDVGEHGGRWVGRATIGAQIDAAVARVGGVGDDAAPGPVRHHVSSVAVSVTSATEATASSYFLVLTSVGVDHWGRYRDRFRVDQGAWLIAERIVRVDGRASRSLMVEP